MYHREFSIKKKHLSFAFALEGSRRVASEKQRDSVPSPAAGGMRGKCGGNMGDGGGGGIDMGHSFYHPLRQPQRFA